MPGQMVGCLVGCVQCAWLKGEWMCSDGHSAICSPIPNVAVVAFHFKCNLPHYNLFLCFAFEPFLTINFSTACSLWLFQYFSITHAVNIGRFSHSLSIYRFAFRIFRFRRTIFNFFFLSTAAHAYSFVLFISVVLTTAIVLNVISLFIRLSVIVVMIAESVRVCTRSMSLHICYEAQTNSHWNKLFKKINRN